MPDTPQTVNSAEPSAPIEALLTAVLVKQGASEGMRAITRRESEFPNPLAAKLTGVALDPTARTYADEVLDAYWSDESSQQDTLDTSSSTREGIVGSGFHAASYAAAWGLSG